MKILKIENGMGYFIQEETNAYIEINNLSKSDIYYLIKLSIEEKVDFDEFEENKLNRPDHKILYEKLLEKIKAVINEKDTLLANKNSIFNKAKEKYDIEE